MMFLIKQFFHHNSEKLYPILVPIIFVPMLLLNKSQYCQKMMKIEKLKRKCKALIINYLLLLTYSTGCRHNHSSPLTLNVIPLKTAKIKISKIFPNIHSITLNKVILPNLKQSYWLYSYFLRRRNFTVKCFIVMNFCRNMLILSPF